jgi:hypothetical protein
MNTAHVRAEAAISTRNGLTVDFADFAIGQPEEFSRLRQRRDAKCRNEVAQPVRLI